MAFRKTVRSGYRSPLTYHSFGEIETKTVSSTDASSFVSTSFTDLSELSDRSLPLTSLKTVLDSGQKIEGRVSFAGSDPAIIENSVHSAVAQFITDHPVKTPES